MKDIVKLLEEIINQNLNEIDFPQVKGNSVRIKHMIVRKSPNGYLVYDTKNNSQIARTFCKTSAIALAKSIAQGKDLKKPILKYDEIIKKNYIDSIFYKNTMNNTTDDLKRDVIEIRFLEAKFKTENAKQSLDSIIFA